VCVNVTNIQTNPNQMATSFDALFVGHTHRPKSISREPLQNKSHKIKLVVLFDRPDPHPSAFCTESLTESILRQDVGPVLPNNVLWSAVCFCGCISVLSLFVKFFVKIPLFWNSHFRCYCCCSAVHSHSRPQQRKRQYFLLVKGSGWERLRGVE